MEFAKDVEIQIPEFQTTQENISTYIDRFGTEWGKANIMCFALPVSLLVL